MGIYGCINMREMGILRSVLLPDSVLSFSSRYGVLSNCLLFCLGAVWDSLFFLILNQNTPFASICS